MGLNHRPTGYEPAALTPELHPQGYLGIIAYRAPLGYNIVTPMLNAQKIKVTYYHLKHHYLTMNNIVVAVALFIAAGWAWGSVTMMQRNYALQRSVDTQQQQAELLKLQVANMQFQQNYYKSDEYKDLAARTYLELASPGEKVLILPANSAAAKNEQQPAVQKAVSQQPSNFDQWVNFLIGASAAESQTLQK